MLTCRISAAVAVALCLNCSGADGPTKPNDARLWTVSIGSLAAAPGDTILIPITLGHESATSSRMDSIRSFNLLISYNYRAMTLLEVMPSPSQPQLKSLPWHSEGLLDPDRARTAVRIAVTRGDKDPAAPFVYPYGVLARLNFLVNPIANNIGREFEISFRSEECEDNTLGDGADPGLLHFMHDYQGVDTLEHANDTLDCPRRWRVLAEVRFVAGLVHVVNGEGGIVPGPGDLSLDGVVDLQDVAKFISVLFRGDSLSSGGEDSLRLRLVAADVNRDGHPLRVADFEMILRTFATNYDPYLPHRTLDTATTVEVNSRQLQVWQPSRPISMIMLDVLLPTDESSAPKVRSDPVADSSIFAMSGNLARYFFDYSSAPFIGGFHPLTIDFNPPLPDGYELFEIQLSTPPGLEVPVTGYPRTPGN